MCNKLLQTYACGHSKSICTTPCAHALKPVNPPSDPTPEAVAHAIARSNPTLSASAPEPSSPVTRTATSTPAPSRLRITNDGPTHAHRDAPPVPAFRLVPPSTPESSPPVSPASPLSPGPSVVDMPARYSAPCPWPALSVMVQLPRPVFCKYYIPRYLTTSRYPCIECYGRPEWEALRARWMESYRLGHPLGRLGDVEVLSGVKGVLEGGGME